MPPPPMRPVYRSLYRPLTLCGVERRLFFLALLVGVAAFNLFFSFLAGCILFVAIYLVAWWSSTHDPRFLEILLRTSQHHTRYDAAKHAPFFLAIETSQW
jgi:type IV secretory pathway TrbD component